MSVKISLAKNIGFCYGVKRAQEMANGAFRTKSARIFMLGPLVHNNRAMADFIERGIKIVKSFKKVPADSLLIISAHGVGPKIKKEILKTRIKVIDTTCPWVSNIQKLTKKLAMSGHHVILVGDKNHREVKSVKGAGGKKVVVISNIGEAKKLIQKKPPWKKITISSQTTQDGEVFQKIANLFKKYFPGIKILNTICPASRERQKEIKKMAKENDLMLVIGSKNSANSRRLFKISKKINKNTYFVAGPENLEKSWFASKIKKMGIISGASTPMEVVKEIKEKVESFICPVIQL